MCRSRLFWRFNLLPQIEHVYPDGKMFVTNITSVRPLAGTYYLMVLLGFWYKIFVTTLTLKRFLFIMLTRNVKICWLHILTLSCHLVVIPIAGVVTRQLLHFSLTPACKHSDLLHLLWKLSFNQVNITADILFEIFVIIFLSKMLFPGRLWTLVSICSSWSSPSSWSVLGLQANNAVNEGLGVSVLDVR